MLASDVSGNAQVVRGLERARDRIREPSEWTRGAIARTASGAIVGPHHYAAVCWCANGALMKERVTVGAIPYLNRAALEMKGMTFVELNDAIDHETVMAMFGRAIAMAKEGLT